MKKTDTTNNNRNKSGRRMWRILIMTFVAIIAISGLVMGGITWHQQPGFCTTCHTPMNDYVDNYFAGDTTLMITRHASSDTLEIRCLDCHEQKLSEQLTEGAHWITGNYIYPLETREFGTRSFCLTEGCHIEAEIIEATTSNHGMSYTFSQHDPRHGKQECYTCHSMHGESVFTCNQCHHFELPDGWMEPQPNGVITAVSN